jgi:hypothetical protein
MHQAQSSSKLFDDWIINFPKEFTFDRQFGKHSLQGQLVLDLSDDAE